MTPEEHYQRAGRRYVGYVPVAPNMVNAPELRDGLMSFLMALVHAEGYQLVPATEIDIADVTPAEGLREPWIPVGYRMFRVAADVQRQSGQQRDVR